MKMYRNAINNNVYLINKWDRVFYWSPTFRSWADTDRVAACDVRKHCNLIANNVRLAR